MIFVTVTVKDGPGKSSLTICSTCCTGRANSGLIGLWELGWPRFGFCCFDTTAQTIATEPGKWKTHLSNIVMASTPIYQLIKTVILFGQTSRHNFISSCSATIQMKAWYNGTLYHKNDCDRWLQRSQIWKNICIKWLNLIKVGLLIFYYPF